MSQTVSKTKEADTPTAEAAKPAPRNTHTNWRVLAEGGFIPVKVRCDGYRGTHPADLSCHTTINPDGPTIARHFADAHGGGYFKIKFRISDSGKQHELWKALEDLGVELQDFYCLHCREQVPMQPRRIIYHLNPHPGANRINLEPQTLGLTLGLTKPDEEEFSDLYVE